MWESAVYDDGSRHVIPLDDLKPHEPNDECWCGPAYDDGVFVHRSMDQRELYERAERKPC